MLLTSSGKIFGLTNYARKYIKKEKDSMAQARFELTHFCVELNNVPVGPRIETPIRSNFSTNLRNFGKPFAVFTFNNQL